MKIRIQPGGENYLEIVWCELHNSAEVKLFAEQVLRAGETLWPKNQPPMPTLKAKAPSTSSK